MIITCFLGASVNAALTVSGTFPAANSTAVCADTVLHLTFSSASTLGAAGKIQIFDAADNKPVDTIDVASRVSQRMIGGNNRYNYFPIMITGNTASIYLHLPALAYGKTYYATVDPGTFKNAQGDFAGLTKPTDWKFTVKPSAPAADASDLTVSADGAGDFCTVQGALDFIPDGNTAPRVIFIRAGAYDEMINVTNKHAITLRGEDRKRTVIRYPNNTNFSRGGASRSVFQARNCNDLVISNLTIHNTSPQGASQAEAIILNGTTSSHAIITNTDTLSYQDTVQINGQCYVSNSYIEGDVDFIWGTGPVFMQNCEVRSMRDKGYYTAIRPANNHGFVFYKCIFEGAPGVTENYLSRGIGAAEVVFMDCTLTGAISDAGWLTNGPFGGGRRGPASGPARAPAPNRGGGFSPNLGFAEFNSHAPDGKPVDVSKRLEGSHVLVQEKDAETIANYSKASYVLGGWEPKLAPVIIRQPLPVAVDRAEKAAFAVTVVAVPDPTYRWQKDGADVAGQTNATCLVPNLNAANAGNYNVIVSNSAGSVTSDVATLKVGN
jgi:hypothetical protein